MIKVDSHESTAISQTQRLLLPPKDKNRKSENEVMINPSFSSDIENLIIVTKNRGFRRQNHRQTILRELKGKKNNCLHSTCGRCFVCAIEAICSLLYGILTFILLFFLCIGKIILSISIFISFIFCYCCIKDSRNPFRIKLRKKQLHEIDSTIENNNIICLSLVDTIIFLSKKKRKDCYSKKLLYETVDGETIKLHLVTRPFLEYFIKTVFSLGI